MADVEPQYSSAEACEIWLSGRGVVCVSAEVVLVPLLGSVRALFEAFGDSEGSAERLRGELAILKCLGSVDTCIWLV